MIYQQPAFFINNFWSGREDLNLRPPEPHSGKIMFSKFFRLEIILDKNLLNHYINDISLEIVFPTYR